MFDKGHEYPKMVLSEKYYKEAEKPVGKYRSLQESYKHLFEEGRKVGIKLMRKKGLDPMDLPNQRWKKTKILKPEDFLPLLRKMGRDGRGGEVWVYPEDYIIFKGIF